MENLPNTLSQPLRLAGRLCQSLACRGGTPSLCLFTWCSPCVCVCLHSWTKCIPSSSLFSCGHLGWTPGMLPSLCLGGAVSPPYLLSNGSTSLGPSGLSKGPKECADPSLSLSQPGGEGRAGDCFPWPPHHSSPAQSQATPPL